jgi:Ca-activated chloride channel family protein
VPAPLPDLFPGAPLVVFGRYRGEAAGSIAIQARDEAGMPVNWAVPAGRTENPALASLWARGRLRVLEDRYVTHFGDHAGLEQQIVDLSLRFGVLCRFTALVAVDVKEVVNPGGEVHRVTQPVELPAGWDNRLLAPDDSSLFLSACLAPARAIPRPGSVPSAAPRSQSWGLAMYAAPPEAAAGTTDYDAPEVMGAQPPPREAKRKAKAERRLAGAPSDLTAYRQRAEQLWEKLAACDVPSLRELGVLAVQLEALLDDLLSVGAGDAELRPLSDLLRDLVQLTAQPTPDAAEVNRLWALAAERLAAFAGSPPEPAKSGWRRWFWK